MDTQTRALATALFHKSKLISENLRRIQDAVDTVHALNPSDLRTVTFYGLFLRSRALTETLEKFDEPKHFQSLAHAERTLIEILTDMVLLYHSSKDSVSEVIFAWEESYKLKSAEKNVDAIEAGKIPKNGYYPIQKQFILTEKSRIDALRLSHGWINKKGQPKHPNGRWSKKKLEQDVVKAYELDQHLGLLEIFIANYTRLNWYTHGSGLTGIRSLDEQSFLSAFALSHKACGELSIQAGKMILKEYGFFEAGYGDTWNSRLKEITTEYENIFRFLVETN